MTYDFSLEIQELNQRARLLVGKEEWDEAKSLLDQSLALDGMCADTYDHLGAFYMAQEKFSAAREQFKKALMIDKTRGETYFNLGNAYLMLSDTANCLDSYNRALSAGFDHPAMQFYLALVYEEKGQFDMAIRHLTRANLKDPSQPDYPVKKAQLLIRMERYDEALELTEDLKRAFPELYDGYHLKTMLLQEKGEFKEAIDHAKDALERFPEDVGLIHDYAKSLAFDEQYDASVAIIEQAKKLEQFELERRNFALLESQIFAQSGNYEMAIEKAKACIASEGEVPDVAARQILLSLLLAKQDFQQLKEAARSYAEQEGKDELYRVSLFYYAFSLKKLGETEEANKAFEQAIRAYRVATLEEPALVDAYMLRSMALKELERYDEALDIINYIIKLAPEMAQLHTTRAEIYHLMGKEQESKVALENAFDLRPDYRKLFEAEQGGD